jgi:hypothetical protein
MAMNPTFTRAALIRQLPAEVGGGVGKILAGVVLAELPGPDVLRHELE